MPSSRLSVLIGGFVICAVFGLFVGELFALATDTCVTMSIGANCTECPDTSTPRGGFCLVSGPSKACAAGNDGCSGKCNGTNETFGNPCSCPPPPGGC